MKKFIIWGIILVLLALDWAALHDILKGEPNPFNEYGMLVFSLLVFAFLGHKKLTGIFKKQTI